MATVRFEGHTIECPDGANLRVVILRARLKLYNGVAHALHCRGHGTCGTCAVRVEGPVTDPTPAEKRRLKLPPHDPAANLRLACQCNVLGDITVTKYDGFFGQNYHPGVGSGVTGWGPIMGAPFGKNLVQWSIGDYDGATNTQDDLAIIDQNCPTRADDHADTIGSATALNTGCADPLELSIDALVETTPDIDVFSFVTGGGSVTVSAVPTTDPGENLDVLLEILDDGGALVASDNPVDGLSATIVLSLDAGEYYAQIDGIGKPGVYSDYGSLGLYRITVSLPACACIGDVDGDGEVGITDFLDLLAVWGPCVGCPEDLNGDGAVDLVDFLALLAAWGPCP